MIRREKIQRQKICQIFRNNLIEKYSTNTKYYYSKLITNLIQKKNTKKYIYFKNIENNFFEGEFLKKYYCENIQKKLKKLFHYYKYHKNTPNLYLKNLSEIVYNFFNKKKDIFYNKIIKEIREENFSKNPFKENLKKILLNKNSFENFLPESLRKNNYNTILNNLLGNFSDFFENSNYNWKKDICPEFLQNEKKKKNENLKIKNLFRNNLIKKKLETNTNFFNSKKKNILLKPKKRKNYLNLNLLKFNKNKRKINLKDLKKSLKNFSFDLKNELLLKKKQISFKDKKKLIYSTKQTNHLRKKSVNKLNFKKNKKMKSFNVIRKENSKKIYINFLEKSKKKSVFLKNSNKNLEIEKLLKKNRYLEKKKKNLSKKEKNKEKKNKKIDFIKNFQEEILKKVKNTLIKKKDKENTNKNIQSIRNINKKKILSKKKKKNFKIKIFKENNLKKKKSLDFTKISKSNFSNKFTIRKENHKKYRSLNKNSYLKKLYTHSLSKNKIHN